MRELFKNKNLKLFFIYFCFSKMLFDSQFQIVILDEIKNIGEMKFGVLEMMLLISSFVAELPSGFLTDYIGYKKTLVLSRVFFLIYSIIMLVSKNYANLMFGFICYGISEALTSGTEETYVYKHVQDNNILVKLNSFLYTMGSIFGLVAVFASGILMEHHWTYIYWLTIFVQFISVIVLLKMDKEVTLKEKQGADGFKHNMITIMKRIKTCYKDKTFLYISIATAFCDSMYSICLIYYPLILREYEYSYFLIALLQVIGILAGLFFVFILDKLEKRMEIKSMVICVACRVIICIFLVMASIFPNAILLYLSIMVLVVLVNIYFPAASTLINEFIHDDIRATTNSVINGTQVILMSVLTPVFIKIMGYNHTSWLLLFCAALFFLSILLLYPIVKKSTINQFIDNDK